MENALATMSSITSTEIFSPELYTRFVSFIDAKEKTVQTYSYALKHFALFIQSSGIARPERESIILYRKTLEAEGKKPTTIQNYITAVKVFFSWLEAEGLYSNVAKGVKGAKLSREHKKDYLKGNQVKEILSGIDRSTIQGKRDFAIMALMVTGGLRTIEVSRANREDLKLKGSDSVLYIQGKGRDEKAEYILVPPVVVEALRDYLSARGKVSDKDPLFISHSHNAEAGARLTTRTISGLCKKYMVSAGYDSSMLTAHSLRHTAVTLSLMGGSSLQETQSFARHKNLSTTMIYAHNLDGDKARAVCSANIVNAIF